MGRKPIRNYTTDFFSGPLTENRLWVLGWFYSDGNVSRDYNSACITTHSQDREVLDKIEATMGCYNKITAKSKQNAYVFRISSRFLCYRLEELGCIPAKSLIITYPSFLSTTEQHKAFIRGVFEGDGSIYDTGRRLSAQVEIASGSIDFMIVLQRVIKEHTGIDSVIRLTKDLPRKLIIGHSFQDSLAFLNFLYENVDRALCMARKRNKWLELKAKAANPPPTRYWATNKNRAYSFYLVSPTGDLHHSDAVRPFAREFDLSQTQLYRVVYQRRGAKIVNGWRLPTNDEIAKATNNDSIVHRIYLAAAPC